MTMFAFDIPNKLNGDQLLTELKEAGIDSDIPVITEGKLWLSVQSSQKSQTEAIVAAHIGVYHISTIQEKLEAAGIDLDELREALGT